MGHRLTAGGTLYDVITEKGEKKKIIHSRLIGTHESLVSEYMSKTESHDDSKQTNCATEKERETSTEDNELQVQQDAEINQLHGKKNEMCEEDRDSQVQQDAKPKEIHQTESVEEEDYVRQILKHKMEKGRIKYLLEFSDDTQEYATEAEAKIDCADMLEEYKMKHIIVKRNVSKRKRVVLTNKTLRYTCECDHDKFDSYGEETNDKYFMVGQWLWNVNCRMCHMIVGSIEREGIFRPTFKTPAYVCNNRTKGCRETLCHTCAKTMMLNSNSKTRRSRRQE